MTITVNRYNIFDEHIGTRRVNFFRYYLEVIGFLLLILFVIVVMTIGDIWLRMNRFYIYFERKKWDVIEPPSFWHWPWHNNNKK